MSYARICTFSEAATLLSTSPSLSPTDIATVYSTRRFARFVSRYAKPLTLLARCAPIVALTFFHPSFVHAAAAGAAVAVASSAGAPGAPGEGEGAFGFFQGHGAILLHMLIVGFLTLLVTTFLKFTGRGDLAPLVVFVGGGVILYEVIQLFNDIYHAVKTFLAG